MNTQLTSSVTPRITSCPQAAVANIKCLEPPESILLLRRNTSEHDPWSGHYAFPGGRKEDQDTSLYDTCVRETREETGIELKADLLVKELPPTRAGRNIKAPILVQPFLFELAMRPSIKIEPAEIKSFLWLDIALFSDQNNHSTVEVYPGRDYPVYHLEDYYLWGFTYGLLTRLLGLDVVPD